MILGRRTTQRSAPFNDLLATGQKLILKLIELNSVLKAEEDAGTFIPTRSRRKAAKKRPRTVTGKALRKVRKQHTAA
jgi:hypothetical protein